MFSSSFSAPWLSAFHSCPQKCQERAGFMFNSVRQRAVNSEPPLKDTCLLEPKWRVRDQGLSQLNTILLCCVLYLLVGATRSCVGMRIKCVISLKCHFLKYHVLYLHGACGLSVCNCGEQLEHRTTRRHPAASNAEPWRGDSLWWKAHANFHGWSQHLHLLLPRLALLVAGLCG